MISKDGFDFRGREVIPFTCVSNRKLCGKVLACTSLVPVELIAPNDPAGIEALAYGGICDRIINDCGSEALAQAAEVLSVPVIIKLAS